jgi:spore coat protein CotH
MKYLLCSLLLALSCPLSGTAQTAADFYDESVVQDLYLDIHPNDWNNLRKNFQDNTYYPAELQWRDIRISDIGVRSRGRSSRSPLKPNLRIDFDRYEEKQKFLGLKSTMLKANNADASMMRERLTMRLFEKLEMPAPREAYARLFVNGEFFGLYNLVESIDKSFLERVFEEDSGYLYEWEPTLGGYRFEYLGEDPAVYSPVMFDPVTHEKDPNPQPIVEMVRAVNQSSDAEFVNAVSPYVDLRVFIKHIAVEAYMAEYDGMLGDHGMNNFHVYRFAGASRHTFVPWDKDLTLIGIERDLLQGVEQNVLARRLMNIPEYRNLFFETVAKAAEIMGGPDGFMEENIGRFQSQIQDFARKDPYKQCALAGEMRTCGAAEFDADVEYVRSFAQRRKDFVVEQLKSLGYDVGAEASGRESSRSLRRK